MSDLHLSQFHDKGRTLDFSRLCSVHFSVIVPDIVVVSGNASPLPVILGDITDAKLPNMRGSRQFEMEWVAYERTVRKFCASRRTIWLDMRGNHGLLLFANYIS